MQQLQSGVQAGQEQASHPGSCRLTLTRSFPETSQDTQCTCVPLPHSLHTWLPVSSLVFLLGPPGTYYKMAPQMCDALRQANLMVSWSAARKDFLFEPIDVTPGGDQPDLVKQDAATCMTLSTDLRHKQLIRCGGGGLGRD